jgi:VanZ family protein
LLSLKTSNRIAWALVSAFIVVGSLGEWAPNQPGVWAPLLVSLSDVAQNVLVYVPFGVFGVLSFSDTHQPHRLRLVIRITVLAILFAASIEAMQLYTLDRVASLIDIASAGIGAAAGGLAISSWRSPK